MSIGPWNRPSARALLASMLPAFVLCSPSAVAHAPPAEAADPSDASRRALDTAAPEDEHSLIDVAPTLAEERELLRRVEEEGLGVNPRLAPQGFASSSIAATDAGQTGRWEPLQDWPVVGVFASLLPDGRVLTFDSVSDDPAESSSDHSFTRAALWDPATGAHTRIDTDTGHNLFCAGFSTLPDGRLFLAGGNADAALNGIEETHTFNPLSDTWARGQRMDFARWYPAVTPLPDGELLITGGGHAVPEVRAGDGAIRQLSSAASPLWDNRLYPWLQTAPDGRVAFLGPATQLGYVDTAGTGSFQGTVQREGSTRNYGSYVMYDVGKVLVAGGGFESSKTDQRVTRLIDLDDDTVTTSGPMHNRRRQHNLTVLADGTVLATGGFASNEGLVDLDNAVYEAELWDPATGQWRRLADEDRARQYHSSALLMPDGRVLSAGGGICGDCQQAGYIQKNGQLFSPPYLFRQDGSGALADRPLIVSAPDEVEHDRTFSVATPEAVSIARVAMVRTGSVTHSQNMEQRYVPLDFSISGDELSVRSPANANIAPPGHYLLFVIDQAGVPSVARIVNLVDSLVPPPPATDATNAAPAGTATQSSTSAGAEAFLAIDGDTDGDAANGSVSRTSPGEQPWWEVDLGEVHDIRQIVVNRRTDCCTERLSNFHVIVSATPFDTTTLADTLAQPSVSDYHVPAGAEQTRLDVDRPGRHVRVQLAGTEALELAEVQVLVEGDGEGSGCGSPDVDPAVDGGVHVWKECGDGPWTLMLTGESGLGTVRAEGKITSELGFVGVTPRSLEGSDTLTAFDPQRTDFALNTSNPWTDHFELDTLDGDDLCLGFDRITAGQGLYIGPYRIPAGPGPVNPETLESCEFSGVDCSAPAIDAATDKALFSWIDCAGVLHLLGTSAPGSARFSGHVHASSRFTATATDSFESSDTLVSISDSDVYFDIGMGGGYADEILLTPASDAELCVELTARSADAALLAGADRTPVTSPFDPRTLLPCEPPGGGDDCGDPQVDTDVDSALFVWKNCDGSWSVRLTGERPDGGVVSVDGSIESSAGFDTVTPVSLEGSDSLSTSPASPLAFDMRTRNPWLDGFDFEVPAGASLCVDLAGVSAGVDLVAGPDRTPVGNRFNPETYASCP